jgi:hypothetical protein
MSFLTLLLKPAPVRDPEKALPPCKLVSAEDRFVDVHVADCSIPVKTFGTAEDNCSICTEQLKTSPHKALPGCGHMFHNGCIDAWVAQKATCPICNKKEAHLDRGHECATLSMSTISHLSPSALMKETKVTSGSDAGDSFRSVQQNTPFILKLNIPVSGQEGIDPKQAIILAYSEEKTLQIHFNSVEYGGDCPFVRGVGTTSTASMADVIRCVHTHGSGKGEPCVSLMGGRPPFNCRGYCQAEVRSNDCVRIYIDRVYPRQPW